MPDSVCSGVAVSMFSQDLSEAESHFRLVSPQFALHMHLTAATAAVSWTTSRARAALCL